MIDHRARALEVNDATYAAWNAHDPDAVAAVFAEDARTRDAGSETIATGRSAVRERVAQLFEAFPDLRLERVSLVIDGNRHADRWVLSGVLGGGPSRSSRRRRDSGQDEGTKSMFRRPTKEDRHGTARNDTRP